MDKETAITAMYPSYAHNPRVVAFLEDQGAVWNDEWMSEPPVCLPEDIPDLVRMASDEELIFSDADNEWVAPLLALQELGKLQAVEVIDPILKQLRMPWFIDDIWDDLRGEEYPQVLSLIGEPAIAPLQQFIANRGAAEWGRVTAITALSKIVQPYPELREACRRGLTDLLEGYRTQGPEMNAFLISALVDIEAVESFDLIREVYLSGNVEVSIPGDLEAIEMELGLREKRSMPKNSSLSDHTVLPWPVFDDIPEEEEEGYFYPTEQIRKEPKIGRNDPCPCGSGMKYKKCCLGK